jgi:hypothetical protein
MSDPDQSLPTAADCDHRPASEMTGPRRLTPAELSAVTGGKGDDDYNQVHLGPGFTYGAYHYRRHVYVGPWGRF